MYLSLSLLQTIISKYRIHYLFMRVESHVCVAISLCDVCMRMMKIYVHCCLALNEKNSFHISFSVDFYYDECFYSCRCFCFFRGKNQFNVMESDDFLHNLFYSYSSKSKSKIYAPHLGIGRAIKSCSYKCQNPSPTLPSY